MKWYNLQDIKTSKLEYKSKIKFDNLLCKSVSSFSEILHQGIPKKNYQLRIVTSKAFNAITLLDYCFKNFKITEVYVAVYRMNKNSAKYIIDLIQNSEFNISIVVSNFFRNNKNYEEWARLLVDLKSENLKVSFAQNHAKVFLCKTICGKYIVFEGSGNLSDNARIEQYLLEDNKKSFDFHKKWITQILKQ